MTGSPPRSSASNGFYQIRRNKEQSIDKAANRTPDLETTLSGLMRLQETASWHRNEGKPYDPGIASLHPAVGWLMGLTKQAGR